MRRKVDTPTDRPTDLQRNRQTKMKRGSSREVVTYSTDDVCTWVQVRGDKRRKDTQRESKKALLR